MRKRIAPGPDSDDARGWGTVLKYLKYLKYVAPILRAIAAILRALHGGF
jgi:hypothetical protein